MAKLEELDSEKDYISLISAHKQALADSNEQMEGNLRVFERAILQLRDHLRSQEMTSDNQLNQLVDFSNLKILSNVGSFVSVGSSHSD